MKPVLPVTVLGKWFLLFQPMSFLASAPPASCWGQRCAGEWARSYVGTWLIARANPSVYQISCHVTTIFAMWPNCLSCDLMFLIKWEDMEASRGICPESTRRLGDPPSASEEEQQTLRRGRQREYRHISHLVHSLYPAIVRRIRPQAGCANWFCRS